jgi:hypothetical protein
MKKGRIVALVVVLVMTAGIGIAGRTSGTSSAKQMPQSATHTGAKLTVQHDVGTVSSVTVSELTLDHTWKGREEKTKFTLDSDTKKEGRIEQGEHVIVYYHLEKGQRVATDLKAFSRHQGPAQRPKPESPSTKLRLGSGKGQSSS